MKIHTLCALAACCLIASTGSTAIAAAMSGQGTWESTLQGRDLDGNLSTAEAFYDSILGITWMADVNLIGAGKSWADSKTWAANLNPYDSGITGWRLPTTTDTGSLGCDYSVTGGTDCGYNVDVTTSEMAHLYYFTLGNLAYYDESGASNQPGYGLSNTGPFSNFLPSFYWSSTENARNTSSERESAWYFAMSNGEQGTTLATTLDVNAWAVHDGDVGAAVVPIPAAAWLFGTGLLGLIGIARKK